MYYKGMKTIKEGKYLSVYLPTHHLASKKGTVYVHRLVAEEKLGRVLTRTEYVHHIDENKYNNEPNNLMIFKTVTDHTMYHNGCNIQLQGDVWVAIPKQKPIYINGHLVKYYGFCKKCGKAVYKQSEYCMACYKLSVSNKPDKDVLEDLIVKYSFENIGRMYNVTGKAVRKWCDTYGIKKQTFYDIPPKDILIDLLLKNSRKQVALMYGVTSDVISNWERKYGLIFTTDLRVKCIELNRVFSSKKEAAQEVYPTLNTKSVINYIRLSCKNGCDYKGYHWSSLPKELVDKV